MSDNVSGQRFKRYSVLVKLFNIIWKDDGTSQIKIVIGIVLIILGSLLSLTLPWCLKLIVECFSKRETGFHSAVFLLMSYGLLWLVSHLMVNVRQAIVCPVFEKGIHKFTAEIFQKILNLSFKYHTSSSTGSIMNSIERAQVSIPIILIGLMFIIFPMLIEVVIAAGILWFYYNIKIALLLLVIFLTYVVFTWYFVPWVVEAQRAGNKCHKKVSEYITDVLMNIEGIHYYSAQPLVLEECEQRMMSREITVTKRLVRSEIVSMGQTIIAGLGFTCMTLVVGFEVMNNRLRVSDFILINGYLIQFLVPLSIIAVSFLRHMKEGFTQMEDAIRLLNQKEDIIDNPSAKNIKRQPLDIFFNNVSFIYPGKEESTLKNVTFHIPQGKSVAIVGANGVGKTTVARLLYRFFDVSGGQITLQKEDIKNIALSDLRRFIGIVPQEIFLLNDTVYANILFGLNNVDADTFKKIIQITNIEEWVNALPDKYMTIVGEQGIKISGGEQKRIGIARALLRNPKILVLDEAMVSLDADTEYQVLNHIRDNYKELTQIIITHNAKHLPDVEMVIYLENGFVRACGSHHELLAKDEGYKKMWQK